MAQTGTSYVRKILDVIDPETKKLLVFLLTRPNHAFMSGFHIVMNKITVELPRFTAGMFDTNQRRRLTGLLISKV